MIRQKFADYPRVHADRRNLAIHLLAVPLFWSGLAVAGAALWFGGLWASAPGVALLLGSLALQAFGDNLEPQRAAPFSGPINFTLRLISGNLIAFPTFVLSGAWWRAWGRVSQPISNSPKDS